jgi:CRISPR type IV-associated protein Csf3
MDNLQVTAHLSTPLVAFDDWSPSLDALLEFQILDRLGLVSPNPTIADAERAAPIVQREMPLERRDIDGEWYWAVSSPHYLLLGEDTQRYRKRWDYHDRHLRWGKMRQSVDTQAGHYKSYDLPRYERLIRTIHWFCVGNKAGIEILLSDVTHIGKKRSQGCGQVLQWQVEPFDQDWHLWRDGHLARPMPISILLPIPDGASILEWGWRPPVFLPQNKTLCYMPTENVCRSHLVMA